MVRKALSVRQPWANMIVSGEKIIETRGWYTKYRGDLVICSTQNPRSGEGPFGKALAVVELYNCRRMQVYDEAGACVRYVPELYSWCLRNVRPLSLPVSVSGQQGLWGLDLEAIAEQAGITLPANRLLEFSKQGDLL